MGGSGVSVHDRLVAAVTQGVESRGCGELTVEQLVRAAGVSRASFYQHFHNVAGCFLFAWRQSADRLVHAVAGAIARHREPERAALEALLQFALERPQEARLLTYEILAGGPLALRERETLVRRLAHEIESAQSTTPRIPTTRIDLPIALLVGGALRYLAMQLRQGDALGERVHEDLIAWMDAFSRPSRALCSPRLVPMFPSGKTAPSRMPTLARHHDARERIVRATAAVVRAKSYRMTSVADIVTTAMVSRRRFYNEFTGRAEAFEAAYEQMFQLAMGACAPAYYSSTCWPERVWNSTRALTTAFAREPALAYLGLVECHALGRRFAQRVHDTQLAFTRFPGDDDPDRPTSPALSSTAFSQATVFEAGFNACRAAGAALQLRRMQPLAVYITLTPVIGTQDAAQFISSKLA